MKRLGCLVLLLPALAFGMSCAPVTAALRAPALDQSLATQLLVAADSARAAAFATADPAPLRPLFADSAIAPLLPELAALRRHGARVEEEDSSRRLVHWTASEDGGQGTLQIAGQERLDGAAGPGPAWSRIVRQWLATVRWSGGRWLIVDARDLPPDQWWRT
ncbi:MAG TPA: hypothetical protein VNG93_12135 [Candidatus Dormibacteraeota bacterium]|nr:hypothetical protein [Candidatus Dormibacteraeota bacterium]